MKKRTLSIVLAALLTLSVLSGCGKTSSAEAPSDPAGDGIEAIKITCGNPATTGTFADKQGLYFAQMVNELSGGKMEIEVFADSLLGTETAMATNIQSGALEMGLFFSTFTQMVSKAGLFDMPYLISDRSQLNTLDEAGVLDEIYAQAEEIGIKVVALGENGFRHITNNKRPVVEPADMAGLVIRVPGNELRAKTFETLGASPVSMAWSEVYQALEQGVCDGQENPFGQIGGAQLYNVQKYLSLSGHIYTPLYICMNLDLYNSLSDKQKAVIQEAGDMLAEYAAIEGAAYDEEQLQACKDNGMEVNEVNDEAFRELLLPLWDAYADAAGGKDFIDRAKSALNY